MLGLLSEAGAIYGAAADVRVELGEGSDENTLKWSTLKFDGAIAGRLSASDG